MFRNGRELLPPGNIDWEPCIEREFELLAMAHGGRRRGSRVRGRVSRTEWLELARRTKLALDGRDNRRRGSAFPTKRAYRRPSPKRPGVAASKDEVICHSLAECEYPRCPVSWTSNQEALSASYANSNSWHRCLVFQVIVDGHRKTDEPSRGLSDLSKWAPADSSA